MKTQITLGNELGIRVPSAIRGQRAIAWFTTKYNKMYGYTLYNLSTNDTQWLRSNRISTDNVYRIYIGHRKSQAIVKINWKRLLVRFLITDDNHEPYKFGKPLPILKLEVSAGYDLHHTQGIVEI